MHLVRGWTRLGFVTLVVGGCYDRPPVVSGGSDESDSSAGTGNDPTTATTMGPTTTEGDPTTATTTPTSTTSSVDTSSSSETSEPQACDAADGEVDPDCDPQVPFCQGGSCVGCDEVDATACAGIDAATPVCLEGVCSGCNEHDQCATGACRIATGECFPEANRLWVDNTADCGAATGTEAAPFCTIAEAQLVLGKQPGSEPWAVFIAGSAAAYLDQTSSSDRPKAFIGPARGLTARIQRTGTTITDVGSQGEVYLARLTLDGGGDNQATVDVDGIAYLDDLAVDGQQRALNVTIGTCQVRRTTFGSLGRTIVVGTDGTLNMIEGVLSNQSGAMLVEGDVTLVRSQVNYSYVEGGIEVTGRLRVVNSMIYDNIYQFGDILAQPGSTVEVLYSVLGTDGLECPGTPGQSEQLIRNSIVLGLDCPSAVIHNSAVGTDAAVMQGQDNALISEADYAAIFVEPNMGGDQRDYHVLAGAPIVTDLAIWEDGDPPFDFDGDARPGQAGASDFAGADVP